jgi:hypothetical protein
MPLAPLTRVKLLAADLLAAHGLAGWEFGFNASRHAGRCLPPFAGRPGRIELSRDFALWAPEAEVREALLREIARALVPGGCGGREARAAKRTELGVGSG